MITLCTVVVAGMNRYMQVFYDMLRRHSSLINEVLIAKTDEPKGSTLNKTWVDGNIKYTMFTTQLPRRDIPSLKQAEIHQVWCGHAFGLHDCISKATNEYVLLCDPDIFFYMKVAELYLDLMDKYSLNMVGISHFNPKEQCYLDFPCVTCCLLKKSTLPDNKFMGGSFWVMQGLQKTYPPTRHHLCYGKWLMPGIASAPSDFPNPDGSFDCGCNLYIWNKNKDGKWIAFTKQDGGIYKTGTYTSNFTVDLGLPDNNMLIHRIEGARGADPVEYVNMYEEINGVKLTPLEGFNSIPGEPKKYSKLLLL